MPPNRKALPAYTPEELLKYGKTFAATFSVPEDIREDMASEFVLAALEAGEKAEPGRGIRSYQRQAGEWAARAFRRNWKREREHTPVSIERCLPRLEGAGHGDATPDRHADAVLEELTDTGTPLAGLARQDSAAALHEAVAKLPRRERKAVELHFLEKRPRRHVAKGVRITEARLSQILSEAMDRLRRMLPNDAAEF